MRSLFFLLALLLNQPVFAMDEGDIRLGVLGGNNSLLSSVGNGGDNVLSTGAIVAYQMLDDIVFNLTYLTSNHTNIGVKHSNLSLGLDYYTGGDGTIAFYVSGGAALLNNKRTNATYDGSAMGVFVGGGMDFQVNSKFLFGLKARYNKAFETAAADGTKTVQDSVDVLAAVQFVLGKK